MKRWITLLILIAFGLGLFASPLLAMERDPGKPLPWLMNENPSGDDGGWNDNFNKDGADRVLSKEEVIISLMQKILNMFNANKTEPQNVEQEDRSNNKPAQAN